MAYGLKASSCDSLTNLKAKPIISFILRVFIIRTYTKTHIEENISNKLQYVYIYLGFLCSHWTQYYDCRRKC